MTDAERERYSRQILFPGIAEAGQERLLGSILSLFAWVAPGRARLLPDWLWRRLHLEMPAAGSTRCDEHLRLLDTRDWFTHVDPAR